MRGLCLSVCRRGVGTVVLGCGMGIVLGVGIVGIVVVGFVVCPLCVCGWVYGLRSLMYAHAMHSGSWLRKLSRRNMREISCRV